MDWLLPAINASGYTQIQIVEQIRVVYDRLLRSFEQTYMAAVTKISLTAPPQQQEAHQLAPNPHDFAPDQPSTQQALQMTKPSTAMANQLCADGYSEVLEQHVEQSRPTHEATRNAVRLRRTQLAGILQEQQQPPQHEAFQNRTRTQEPFQNFPSLPTQGGTTDANGSIHGLSAGSSRSTETTVPEQQHLGAHLSFNIFYATSSRIIALNFL